MRRTLTYGTLLTGLCFMLAALTLLLSGCGAVKQALNIENPRYSIRDIRPRVDIALPLSASSIDIDFAIEVDNPNSVGLRLDEIDFNLYVNENRVLDSISSQNIEIPANRTGLVNLRTRIGYQQVGSLFRAVADAITGNRAKYEIRGDAYYRTPLGRLKFPVTVFSSGR
ncbi:MAG TPA: LEA type 2 family protein [Thermoanaerobaculia bacterium]